jgi:uncharacterized alpha-E superfamily protein
MAAVDVEPGAGAGFERNGFVSPIRGADAALSRRQAFQVADQHKAIEFLTFDERNPNSILSCLRAARENARTCEMISTQMWEELNKFHSAGADRIVARAGAPFEFFQLIWPATCVFAAEGRCRRRSGTFAWAGC